MANQVRFGISIATYRRPDGATPDLLKRAIESVYDQTYGNWKLYVIGDNYGLGFGYDIDEAIEDDTDAEQTFCLDLPYAIGRDDGLTGMELWRVGGFAAMNFALSMQHLDRSIEVHAHLDDDDYWLPDHLETLAEQYAAQDSVSFVYTQTRRHYRNHDVFPKSYDNHVRTRRPKSNGLIHSSASWRLKHVTSMYVPNADIPADSDLWDRMSEEIHRKKTISLFVPKVTVVREHSQKYAKWGETE